MKASADWNGKHIVISRTDSIGDVLLTLPVCAALKERFPNITITFLCKQYTAPIVSAYQSVDHILIVDDLLKLNQDQQIKELKKQSFDAIVHVFPKKELARLFKKAKVPTRIGTSHRIYHFLTCNVRPSFTRKGSPLHESQLNFKLLELFGFTETVELSAIEKYGKNFVVSRQELPAVFDSIDLSKTICLHPKSQGSALEWPMEKYIELAEKLVEQGNSVCFTGTEKEGVQFRSELPNHPQIIDSTGLLSIEQLMWVIHETKGLVACSTGPLHIAATLGKKAVGLYSPRIPIHPGRWMPIGKQANALVYDENCPTCAKGEPCDCITRIPAERVLNEINR